MDNLAGRAGQHRLFAGEAMRFACDLLGTERLLFASDYPWVQPDVILRALHQVGLPTAQEQAILQGNARRLFRL